MSLIKNYYGCNHVPIPTNLIVKELVFNYLGDLDVDSYLTNTIIKEAKEATNRANAAVEAFENIDVSQFQQGLEAQKLDTGITATAKNGGIARTQAEKNTDYISIKDFGLVADGVADDSLKLQTIESAYTNRQIDMLGKTVLINALPSNNTYYNGWFKLGGGTYRSNLLADIQVTERSVLIGANVPVIAKNNGRAIVGIGDGVFTSNTGNVTSSEALGTRALHSTTTGKYNTAIGFESQYELVDGTRNVGIGANSLRFNKAGNNNIGIGRNAGQGLIGSGVIAIGGDSMTGVGSLKFKNLSYIQLQTPVDVLDSVSIGRSSSRDGGGNYNVAVGAASLESAKKGTTDNVAIGYQALSALGNTTGYNGGTLVQPNVTGTYVMSTTEVTFTFTGTTIKVGDKIYVRFQTGIPLYSSTEYRDLQIYTVKRVSGNTVTVDELEGVVASGTVLLEGVEDTALPATAQSSNVAIGRGAMFSSVTGEFNVAIGRDCAVKLKSSRNIAIGGYALLNHTDGTNGLNVAVGHGALGSMQDSTPNTNSKECVGLGNNTRVSGNNQIQLGNAGHTTYSYGAIQDRSDARDKIVEGDITDAHISFFNDVEFKRYRLDYRDDYIEIDDDGNITKLAKDGSKARKREHVGVIAQQVEQAMQAHNVDFAGLQHHAVNGGNDVYTVGYQEFIPILGEIVQRQQKQIDELKALIKKQS